MDLFSSTLPVCAAPPASFSNVEAPGIENDRRRDYCGFLQVRPTGSSKWHFVVTGFDGSCSGETGYCSVMRADESEVDVSIDTKDRILIEGKRYGPEHWNH